MRLKLSQNSKFTSSGFTLIEIIIVIIVISALAGLALVNLNRVIEKERCERAKMNLLAIYTGAAAYYATGRTHVFVGYPVGMVSVLADINDNLGTDILNDPDFDYEYWSNINPQLFFALAKRKNNTYELSIDQDALAPDNPFCSSGLGTCPCF